ncbi:multiubiquitin domain-containing protein [Agrobacterium fabrum]|uniref:multiubiquitin domain-containing protein n=1 Tax=Agrobacterium fabrum TaxID=1176649 RepID=UPI0024757FF5|nr:multiubiquitin domain-containing protein [Agrobacterium fabrum]MDH6298736.1 hypothetical protein [Agrobacterium fabrum]
MVKDNKKFEFTVDGALYSTGDKVMDGSQIRETAGKVPASEFVLIQIVDKSGRSIGLEDDVKFAPSETAVFLSFESDRVYNFTVDERGWEWGAAAIAAADIYRYADIDKDRELVLDSDGDTIIPVDGKLDLSGKGVERVRSREPKTVTIKVNGRPRTVEKRRHSYREIAAIAYPNPDFENFNYTTTYLHGVGGAEGDLVEGESIMVKNGMVFNVRRSDKS